MTFIYRLKILFLLAFVFSIPFENWDPFGIAAFFTITKMAGVLYFICSILTIKHSFKVEYQSTVLKLLFSLWLLICFQSLVNYSSTLSISPLNLTFLQNIIVFWVISNDLIFDSKLQKRIFASLIFGVFLMNLLASLGIGIDMDMAADSDFAGSRLTFFGSNSNTVGNLCSIAFILILVMVVERDKYFGKYTFLLMLGLPGNLVMIGLSGSRGALGIVVVGLFLFLITYRTTLEKKVAWVVLGSVVSVFVVGYILENGTLQNRLETTTQGGSLGGRDEIWAQALTIFYDYPLLGSGITGYEQERLSRFSEYVDTHNIFLYFLVTGGLLALALYLLFLHQLLKSALNIYLKKGESLMIILLGIYLFTVSKSGGAIDNKMLWLLAVIIYAYKYTEIKRVSEQSLKRRLMLKDN